MSLTQKRCVPCEAGTPALTTEQVQNYTKDIGNYWEIAENKKIKRMFKFKNFKHAIGFINKVADIAELESHHPNLHIYYNKVKVVLTTHAIGGLSENDFIMAAKIDKITQE